MRETLRKANIKLEEFQKMQQGSGEIETLEVIRLHDNSHILLFFI